MRSPKAGTVSWLAAVLAAGAAFPALAIDGVILIDQNKALAGNVTPGDAAGFPVTIGTSGSYRLSGNLTVPDALTSGVIINANNVTLDLNGFAIRGPVDCRQTLASTFPPFPPGDIVCTNAPPSGTSSELGSGVLSSRNGVVVQNGAVQGMGGYGILLLRGDSGINGGDPGSIVRDVVARSNFQIGIAVAGMVTRSVAILNQETGISASLIDSCIADRNRRGFTSDALVTRSIARGNVGLGLECSTREGAYSNNTFARNNLLVSAGAPQATICFNTGQNTCNQGPCQVF